ncbi:MAG TPA: tRNA (adenosine(37)-N6)-dimethylallyltransferase MiaA [Kofleriaceae bacterium]|nr:tRNA (adenosine(37)-N6)-dimethylallyltransferase MiaA [Kofleriaceae bacterium]
MPTLPYTDDARPAGPRLVVVVGPTGAGKSQLAVDVARAAGGEVVSADSQQVYRGMDIGTGKVTFAERAGVPHHLIDVCDPDQEMTAARFAAMADQAIAGAAARGAPVVVAGGTGLYVRALLLGLFAGPPADPALRARLEAEAAAGGGAPALWRRLDEVDPDAAARIEPTDLKRIVRALEVLELTGVPMSEHQRRHDHRRVAPRYPARLVGLCPPDRDELYRRIDARVDRMMEAGLVDEVRRLREAGYGPGLRSQGAIGYAEIHRHLDGALSLGDAVRLIKRNSRRYARRQLSWYRGDPGVEWHPDPAAVAIADLESYLRGPE